mmetsp:Transcript_11385/g.13045  ORF Transcript_11385/g.13045 Transcript_11385/m.13045 type:complete len:393 (+) Transcript_11385:290-1468(+)
MSSLDLLLASTSTGGLATFNIHSGFVEALLRGYRLGFLSDQEYHHIQQCDNLEDVKLNLQETDYGNFLQNEPKISPSIVREKCLDKLVSEFEYLRSQAQQPLAQFLDFITYDYMIDNVMLILKATMSNPNVTVSSLIEQAHPLGRFKASTLKSIVAFENTPQGYSELYQSVLIDTPIGKYFFQVIKDSLSPDGNVQEFLKEMPTTKLENMLRKLYLEDFFRFCEKLGGETAFSMCELLRARADAMAINITLNSFGTYLNDPSARISDRKQLYPSIGHLYPEGIESLALVGEEAELANVLRSYPSYYSIFEKHQQGEKSIDDSFYERDVMLNELFFEGQFHYGAFYSFVRLKEQEIRNLVWICECIVQRQKDRVQDHFVKIFSRDAEYRKSLN